jgi:hypothetical protein
MPKILATLVLALIAVSEPFAGPTLSVPNRAETVKFAVLGDNGSGSAAQYEVANQMATLHRLFAFGLVIMLGDNFYGSQTPGELTRKFDRPYRALLDSGVTFQAAIGNHDEPVTVNYPPLNMAGQRSAQRALGFAHSSSGSRGGLRHSRQSARHSTASSRPRVARYS